MTLQELKFILALAEEKHFGKAAKACFVSQPTLSIGVRKLEKELNVTLFECHKNSVQITETGKQIIERAKRILLEVDGIKQITTAEDPLKGTVKLGVIYTVGPYLLPLLITALHKVAPRLSLEIQENFTAVLREKLNHGDIDAAIISLPFSEPGILTRVLYKESFVVLMPTNHPLAKHKAVRQEELTQYNVLVLGEGHCFRDQVALTCPSCFLDRASAGLNWRTVAGSSLETIRHMVAANMGITILPASAAKGPYRPSLLTTRPLKGISPYREVALAWRKNFPHTKVIECIMQAASVFENIF